MKMAKIELDRMRAAHAMRTPLLMMRMAASCA